MEDITYETAIQELETILRELQEEQVSIDQLVRRSDRAAALIEYCKQQLQAVERQVEEQS